MHWVRLLAALTPAAVVLTLSAPGQAQQAACFYEHANFQGRQICLGAGQNVGLLDPSWNDRVSSAQIPPGLHATICEHANFAGRCVPLDRSIGNLSEIGFNDKVSSISVDRAGPGPGRPGMGGPPGPGMGGPPGPGFGGPPEPRPGPGPQFGGPPGRDDEHDRMMEYRSMCDAGDRRACVQFGVLLGRNWERRTQYRQSNPDWFWWER
jgi:hypothetical protein